MFDPVDMDEGVDFGGRSFENPSLNVEPALPVTQPGREFRDIQVKVHIRRPERDSWAFLGRALVSQEIVGQKSMIVVRAMLTGKVWVVFGETSDLQAEKRGSFIVISCVHDGSVVSWALNALNNSETLRLLASIELASYKCSLAVVNPQSHIKHRKRIERVIKEDRRRRHKRRKDSDAMIDAFSRQHLDEIDSIS